MIGVVTTGRERRLVENKSVERFYEKWDTLKPWLLLKLHDCSLGQAEVVLERALARPGTPVQNLNFWEGVILFKNQKHLQTSLSL